MRTMEQQNTKEFIVTSPEMMGDVVDVVLSEILSRTESSVIGLSGDLGAGKTTFMRAFLAKTGISDKASSPTFVVRKSYAVPENSPLFGRFSRVSHVDAYRLESGEDMKTTGIDADIQQNNTLLFVEWPERLGESFSKHPALLGTLVFEHVDDETRRVRFLQ